MTQPYVFPFDKAQGIPFNSCHVGLTDKGVAVKNKAWVNQLSIGDVEIALLSSNNRLQRFECF
jgi:hypothetical protein